ncbi:hypothetical protein VNI00_014742 [Paramarasmius palmivorus]|uniref:RING-type domain-containing protein n=1 Tax=Paramarasmius palmivorus TaxID=297713 RepID=A0AAW0BQZ2_9AGAR
MTKSLPRWEPLKSLQYCKKVCKEFWDDVGGPGPRKGRMVGFTLTSSDAYRQSCLEQCQAGIDEANRTNASAPLQTLEVESTEPSLAAPMSFKTHSGKRSKILVPLLQAEPASGNLIAVPDASLLLNPPEALGLVDLCANDRYQIVLSALKAKKVDASEILYKKAKKDSKEDPSWRRAACSICYDGEDLDDSGRLLACQCRSHIYCKVCVQEWIKKSRVRAEGLISCPQCRCIVYTISSAWIFLTPEEERHRNQYREDKKAKKRARNKQNKREAEARKRVRLSEEAQQRKNIHCATKGEAGEGVHEKV